jgi:hypothetical protein
VRVLIPIVLLLIRRRHITVAVKLTVAHTQRFVRRVPLTTRVEVVIIVIISRGHPASTGTGTTAFKHAANFLTEWAWKTYGERVRAHATPTDGVFTARGAVCG